MVNAGQGKIVAFPGASGGTNALRRQQEPRRDDTGAAKEGAAPLVEVRGVAFSYGKERIPLFIGLDFELHRGEIVSVMGTSGVGKTTLLGLVSGEKEPDEGRVVRNCDIAQVAQDYVLFPHCSALKNVEIALRRKERLMRRLWPAPEQQERAAELLQQVGLKEELHARMPSRLSGGQRQRVALAQALAQGAELLLMDEPFGALDPLTRHQLQTLIIRLARECGISILLVTHDLEEALFCSDRILLLREGQGKVREVEEHVILGDVPRTPELKTSGQFLKKLAMLHDAIMEPDVMKEGAPLLDRGLVSERDLVRLERMARRIVVISRDLFQERNNKYIQDAVLENLKYGKEYIYIISETSSDAILYLEKVSNEYENVRYMLKSVDDPAFFLGEVVIYEMQNGGLVGYSYMGDVRATALVRLTDQVVEYFWRKIFSDRSQR